MARKQPAIKTRILITGHEGYLGSVLVPTLLAKGHDVAGVDCHWYDGCDFLASKPKTANLEIDFRELTPADLCSFDAVIHLAALSDDRTANLDDSLTEEINEHAAIQLAQQCKAAGVPRFVFASSCSVYGAPGPQWVDECSPLNPQTPYARAKWAVERQLRPMADRSFCPISLRIGTVYGVAPRLRIDTVVNEFVASAIAHRRINMHTIGLGWRPFVHIEDLAHAMAAILNAPTKQICGETFNLVRTEDNYRVRDLAEMICDVLPHCQWKASVEDRDEHSYRVDGSKLLAAIPDFQFEGTLTKGIKELALAMERNSMTPAQFRSDRYRRAQHLFVLQARGDLNASLRRTRQPHSLIMAG